MSGYDAILFDKDGTLFDFQATWSTWAARVLDRLSGDDAELKSRTAQAIAFEPGRGFRPESIVIAGTTGEVVAALAAVFPDRDLTPILDEISDGTPQVPVPDLAATLATLGKTRALGVVTNDSEAPARTHLAEAGILDRFAFIAGYDSGHGAKPAPGPLLAFCKAVGVAPARALMVGDSLHDLHAGRAAGMGTVAVLTGVARVETLAPHADVVLPGIAALPGWLSSG
jgi:phosphoglycolate phosphatase